MKAKHYIALLCVAIGMTLANGANNPLIPTAFMAVAFLLIRDEIGKEQDNE